MNNSFPIFYVTYGNPQHPPMVLIMGVGAQLIHWPKKFIENLVNQGFYIIVFDNRDSGLSKHYDQIATPSLEQAIAAKQLGKQLPIPYTLNDMAADVIVLMDELALPKAHIVGISMGGMIAQIFALHYPDRLLSLTCIATTTGDLHLPPSKPQVLEFFSKSSNKAEDLETYVNTRIAIHKIYNHPDYYDDEAFRLIQTQAYQRAYYPDGFTRQLLAVIFATPRGEQLKKLRIKSLVIHGEIDPTFPVEHGKYLAQCLQNSHLEIIEKMGHGIPDALCKKIVQIMGRYLK